MNDLISFENMELEHLAEAANMSAEQVEKSARSTVQHADRAGRALLEAKSRLPHGNWLPWLGANFDQSISLANKYMAIASNSECIPNLLEAPNITQAMRMITEAREEQAPKRTGVVVSKPAPDPAESPDVIEAESRPVEPKPRQSNPRSSAAPRKTESDEFDLGSSLDEDRSDILEKAADYTAAKQLKHFIVMLRKVAADLEVTTP